MGAGPQVSFLEGREGRGEALILAQPSRGFQAQLWVEGR